MTDEIEQVAARLVIGRKSDARAVYDEQAKAELVLICKRPGVSKSKLARQCGVNANQLSRWVREHEGRKAPTLPAHVQRDREPTFVPMVITPSAAAPAQQALTVEARLPNGVVLDLRGCNLEQARQFVQTLGSLPCSASSKR
jgi:transposase